MVRYLLGTLAVTLSLSSARAQMLPAAIDVLNALPPQISLADAHGVAIVPAGSTLRGTPGWTGRGVLVKRENGWSEPLLVTLNSGARTGTGEPVDLVLVFRTAESLDRVTNKDKKIGPGATAYTCRNGTFTEVSLAGAALTKSFVFSFGSDRKQAAELKSKLTELAARTPAPEAKSASQINWALMQENQDVVLGVLGVMVAWVVAQLKR